MSEPGQREVMEELKNQQLIELAEAVIFNVSNVLVGIQASLDRMASREELLTLERKDKVKKNINAIISRLEKNISFLKSGEWQRYEGVEEFLSFEVNFLNDFKSFFGDVDDLKIEEIVMNWGLQNDMDTKSKFNVIFARLEPFRENYLMKKMNETIKSFGYNGYSDLPDYNILETN